MLLAHGLASGPSVWNAFAGLADPAHELWTAALPWRGSGVPGWPDEPAADWMGRAVAGLPDGPRVLLAHSFAASALLGHLADPAADLAAVAGSPGSFSFRPSTGRTRRTSAGRPLSTTSAASPESSKRAWTSAAAGGCGRTSGTRWP
ncbi:alpha/beta fold hydrolase [Streptomyces sp. M19]